VTKDYLKNYKTAYQTDNNRIVNPTVSNRFYAIKDWTIENAPVNGNITTGAHVDAEKSNSMTFTSTWDGFGILTDHKTYQTVTLPAGNYSLTVKYGKWEGQCGNSYLVANIGKGLPDTDNIDSSLAYTKMVEKEKTTSNVVRFTLEEETVVSLGLLVNLDGKQCMVIESFTLESDNTEHLDANGETATSIENIIETECANGTIEAIYDLQGRRVIQPQSGHIYIKNGKKFLAK
jgi:hypothetical protein